ncbi:hypothetical protein KDD30_20460 (plasmid) [Photobacterium sp. GJ3]|uniref:hypothetical protein n=1 Tax=Photobacterium sp. GJ3 TaxID=2829502 RepID=UPI001B8CE6AC|nr:hypothetical protein [Photobacterium sp. GJ3]QUJ70468.1 hypothetical protein KDD30_20460 [Photobacterium sp. GJ3]
MKYLFLLMMSISCCSSASDGRDLIREALERGLEVEPMMIISSCSAQDKWCQGYMSAVVQSLDTAKVEVCLPKNDVGKPVQDGLWAIVESWLYRQPKDTKVSLFSAIYKALTEHTTC